MTHVVTEACINCKYTDCVDVCPVDCFKEGPNFLTIDPDECIDCAVCIPECPVNAILPEEDVPQDQLHFIKLNAELARGWPSITKRKPALPDAEEDLPKDQLHMTQINAELARSPNYKTLTKRKDPLPDHAAWAQRTDKLPYLKR